MTYPLGLHHDGGKKRQLKFRRDVLERRTIARIREATYSVGRGVGTVFLDKSNRLACLENWPSTACGDAFTTSCSLPSR